MLIKLTFIIAIYVLLVSLSYANDSLILIEHSGDSSYQEFDKFHYTPLFSDADFSVGRINKNDIKLLQNHPYQILDDYQEGSYCLLSTNPGTEIKPDSKWGTCLYKNKGLAIVKTDNLPKKELFKLNIISTPLKPMQSKSPSPGRIGYNRTRLPETRNIQELINAVNPDSIAWFIQQMQDFQTRFATLDNRFAVCQWIKQQFDRMNYADVTIDTFTVDIDDSFYPDIAPEALFQENVVCTLPGTLHPDEYIYLAGHYDSCNNLSLDDPFAPAPGADDDASGVAAVLEIARIIKASNYEPECTIKFIAHAGEELGYWGARNSVKKILDNDLNLKALLNNDMIATSFATENYPMLINKYGGFEYLSDMAIDLSSQYTDLIPSGSEDDSRRFDSFVFWQAGLPCVSFFEHDFCPGYHTANDLLINCNMNFCAEIVKLNTAMLHHLCIMPDQVSHFGIYDQGSGTTLLAKWRPVEEDNITQYKLKIKKQDFEAVYYASEADTTFLFDELETDALYTVEISAINDLGIEGFTTSSQGIPKIYPLSPRDFAIRPHQHSLELEWAPNAEVDLAGYRVYRSTVSGTLGDLITTLSLDQTSYIDNTTVDGTCYYYSIGAFDTQEYDSPISTQIGAYNFSLNQGILVIDHSSNGDGTPFHPTDVEVDTFYSGALEHFSVTNYDVLTQGPPSICIYGAFTTVIIQANVPGVAVNLAKADDMSKYLDAGGNLLISSFTPMRLFRTTTSYPAIFDTTTFECKYLKMFNTDFSNQARFHHALNLQPEYPLLEIDTTKVPTVLNNHLCSMEVFTPNNLAQPVYSYKSLYDSNTPQGMFNDCTVGYGYYGNDFKIFVTSVPLYYIKQEQVHEFLTYVVHDKFNEPLGTETNHLTKPLISLSQNYPNPFNPVTSISFSLDKEQKIDLSIYNIKGQKVTTLYKGLQKQGYNSRTWDGKDQRGNSVTSGIYFYRLKTETKTISRKMILLK